MCLTTKQSVWKIATRDIVCYKVLRVERHLFGLFNKYRTPYRGADVKIGKTYTSNLDYPDRMNDVKVGLHSFVSERAAYLLFRCDSYVIVKCIIPIGSRYYDGMFDYDMAYASNKLKYIKIVK